MGTSLKRIYSHTELGIDITEKRNGSNSNPS